MCFGKTDTFTTSSFSHVNIASRFSVKVVVKSTISFPLTEETFTSKLDPEVPSSSNISLSFTL